MANVQITQLPNAEPLTGTEAVPIVQNGVTVKTTTSAIANAPVLNQTFLTVSLESTLPNSRYFSTDANISIADNGAQSYYRIGLQGAVSEVNSMSTGIMVKTSPTTLTPRSIAVANDGLSITDANGVDGNPTLSLSGLPLALAQSSGSGLLSLNSGSTLSPVTITGTSGQIAVSNGTGVGGNPTISLTDTAVVSGTYTNATITVDAQGRLTFADSGTASGSVTSIAVASANGFSGTVADPNTDAVITLRTTVTGVLKGNGTAISAATSGVDYAPATSGTSIFYGNGSGGFSNVTVGSGLSFSGGTLSATGAGTVTSVTASAPLASSGGSAPNITITQAGASSNGYLSSTDWNTFNNKGSGTVTNVSGTAPVSVANGTTTPTISMHVADSTHDGYLSSTDWSTFNSKAPATSGSSLLYGNGTGGFSNATVGTGLSFSGGTLTNTAPDQTVSLTGGTGISTSGTYPNFTITNTLPDQVVSLTGAGTTTVTGTYPNFTITSTGGAGGGDVTGPASSTDNAITRFDGTTGKLIQNSVVTIDDTGNIAGAATITDINYVDFNTGYSTAIGTGQLGWDGNNTLGLGMAGGNVVQHIGEDSFIYAKASSAITKGEVVMFTGAVGASAVPTGAPATGVTDGSYIMGIAAESIALNGFGLIQTLGTLRNVNTTGYADGDILWYDPSVTGGLTKTKPSAPNVKVQMAAVLNGGSAGGGSILIRVSAGSTLGGTDSNAQINGGSNGQIISYDGGNGYYTNTTLTAGTAISVSSSVNGVLTITNTGVTSLTAGTGISLSGSTGGVTVTNSAPDQIVAFTNGTGISVTGTYPNFTITNTSPSSGGTVTSVAALTLGTTGTDLSSTVANSTTTPVITLNVPTASATNRGALSSTDWSTFNGKQAAYTNLTSIGSLANATGWLYNNGSGTFSYSTPTKTDVGLGNVTNDTQTKAAIVPNTAPSAGQILVGNAGGTAYAPVSMSSDATLASTGALTLATVNSNVGSFTNASVTVNAKGLVTAVSSGTAPVTTFSAGTTGFTPSSATSGAVTLAGTLALTNGGTGKTSAPAAMANLIGFTTTATAAGTTVLDNTSSYYQVFTGTTTQTITLPVTSTLAQGWSFHLVNNSTGNLTVNSSGGNLVITVLPGTTVMATCILTSGTTAASWETGYTDFSTATGTGNVVLATSPTLTTPTLGVATATSVNGLTITSTTGTLTLASGKTLTANNSITLSGTDSTTMTFPSTSQTLAGLGVAQTFTATNTFSQINYTNNAITASANAATVPITYRLNTVTNNSAATLTITMTTTSAVDGQMSIVRILDASAVAQTIAWVNTENSTVSVPTTSNGSTTLPLTVGFMYNSATSKWRCIASA